MRSNCQPVVSVLLPAFDAGATLEAALRSVARQREERWECVVVDDGSRDGLTGEVARSWAGRDARFRVVETPHRGLVAALNTGIGHCRGHYVARMDADDLMHSRRLSAQLALLESRPELQAAGCHVRFFPVVDVIGPARIYRYRPLKEYWHWEYQYLIQLS